MDILIAYDIADTDGPGSIRLRRIADICQRYGERVQLSVFECRLTSDTYTRLLGEIQDTINPGVTVSRSTASRGISRRLGPLSAASGRTSWENLGSCSACEPPVILDNRTDRNANSTSLVAMRLLLVCSNALKLPQGQRCRPRRAGLR